MQTRIQKILTITTITTFASLALANAQATTTATTTGHHDEGMHRPVGRRMIKVDLMKLILAGDFTAFQAKASTTPFAKLDSATFSNLSTQMNAEKTAREKIGMGRGG